jgi:branched-chain amino acid transport system substrate-binding protein
MKRAIKSLAICLGTATVLAAAPVSAQSEPIKLGFLTIKSGALAAGGRQMEEGLRLCLDERNNKMAGRDIELFVADTAGQPAQTKTKTQELVQRNDVDVIIGPLAAFEALAINNYVKRAEVPIISPSAGAEDLTQRDPNPWFVRAVGTSAQSAHALGEYAANELGYKRIATISDDFAFGHELTAGFQRVFEENGGKVVQKLWPPLNVADYGAYIAQISPDVDAVFAGFAGGNGIRFLKQYQQYGRKGRTPVLGHMTTVDEGILKNMGSEAVGVVSSGWYSAAIDTPENKAFVDAIRERHNADPGYYTNGAYTACLFMEKALQMVDGNVEDKEAFMEALRNVEIESSPRGPISVDGYGNPVMPIYIREVKEKDGRLQNVVLKTYPDISQFWTYDPEEFLAQPVYSRDYPPAKHLEE